MTTIVYVTVLSVALAVSCGVVFSIVYPMVPVDGRLVSLFAMIGLAASLSIFGLCRTISGRFRKKSTP